MEKGNNTEVDLDAQKMLKSLREEEKRNADRSDLLREVEAFWETDEMFRYSIRQLVRNSPIKDVRGIKPGVNPKELHSLVRLCEKLGFTEKEAISFYDYPCTPDQKYEALRKVLQRYRKSPNHRDK